MSRDTATIEILGKILGRLVNVALFIIITILSLALLREAVDMNLALIALLSIAIGVLATIVVRYLFKLLLLVADLFS